MWACVCLRLICRGISIRIDLQQAFSSDIEIHFLCGSENGGWKHVGSQRACFLATCLSQYGKLTVLWCWSQMVCMWVCDWGGKEGWLCEGREREEGRKGLREGEREVMRVIPKHLKKHFPPSYHLDVVSGTGSINVFPCTNPPSFSSLKLFG